MRRNSIRIWRLSHVVVGLFAFLGLFAFSPRSAAFDIVFDYRFDTNNFFGSAGSQQRTALDAAASFFEGIIGDDLEAIAPSGSNHWQASFFRPDTGTVDSLDDLTIAADSILIFAGSTANGEFGALGEGGPGGLGVSGSASWVNTVIRRGEEAHGTITPGTPGDDTEIAPWGGSLSFNQNANIDWNFSVDTGPTFFQYDFYSVAIHELGHALGFSIADSFDALVDGSNQFTGLNASGIYGGPVPLDINGTLHIKDGVTSDIYGTSTDQPVALGPFLYNGERLEYTELDVAVLDDIGWEIVPEPGSALLFLIGGFFLMLRRPRR